MKMKMKKTTRELYQDGIEGMKGLKYLAKQKVKIKNLKCIQKTILKKLKIIFPIFLRNIKGFFKYIADKERDNIDYEILSFKVDNINFYDRYNTLYNYLNYFSKLSTGKISIKNELFLKNLSKGFKVKKAYNTKDKNNIEKAYDDLVFGKKEIDVFL